MQFINLLCCTFCRETCADQHQQNLKELKGKLTTLLENSLDMQSEYTLWCEARLGKNDWRAHKIDLRRNLCMNDVSGLRNREFYTR